MFTRRPKSAQLPYRMRKRRTLSLLSSLCMLMCAFGLTILQQEIVPTVSASGHTDKDIHLVVVPYEIKKMNRRPSCVHSRSHLQLTNTVSMSTPNDMIEGYINVSHYFVTMWLRISIRISY
jgi:hypothetical protein